MKTRTHLFTKWKSVVTTARSDGESGYEVSVKTEIGSFAFGKFEFRIDLKKQNDKNRII